MKKLFLFPLFFGMLFSLCAQSGVGELLANSATVTFIRPKYMSSFVMKIYANGELLADLKDKATITISCPAEEEILLFFNRISNRSSRIDHAFFSFKEQTHHYVYLENSVFEIINYKEISEEEALPLLAQLNN